MVSKSFMSLKKHSHLSGLLLLLLGSFVGGATPAKSDTLNEDVKVISQKYSEHVLSTYQKLQSAHVELQKQVKAFTGNPSLSSQDATKEAWKKAREIYSRSEAFRFYAGPIDAPDQGVEALMNAWPIDEAYIDAVKEKAQSGVINNPSKYPSIKKENLVAINEKDGERNVATGYHAVEFLLWGQDFDLKKSGQRSFEDYVPSRNSSARRRAQYLEAATDLLLDHSNYLVIQWQPNAAYPKAFALEKPDEILRRILTGLTSLSADEMAGERMTVALEKHDQENEQDCFSDYSLEDLASNQQGILDVYATTGLKELFTKKDKALEAQISKQLEVTKTLIQAIPAPFDQVIADSKKSNLTKAKVQRAIESLQKQAHLMSLMAKKYKVELNVQ